MKSKKEKLKENDVETETPEEEIEETKEAVNEKTDNKLTKNIASLTPIFAVSMSYVEPKSNSKNLLFICSSKLNS